MMPDYDRVPFLMACGCGIILVLRSATRRVVCRGCKRTYRIVSKEEREKQ